MTGPTTTDAVRSQRSVRRTLLLILLVGIAPVIASYVAYYLWPREARVNYGDLIAAPAPPVSGRRADGKPFALDELKGRWVMVWSAPAACSAPCSDAIYATRQARTMQNREQDRIVRVWLVTDGGKPDDALLQAHPGLETVHVGATPPAWPAGQQAIYLVDPLGNIVLAWPARPDIKALAADLARLLRASRIG